MDWQVHYLGAADLRGCDDAGVLVSLDGGGWRQARITDAGIEPLAEMPATQPPHLAPFALTDLGKKRRLAWPAGAMAVERFTHLAVWSERYAVMPDNVGFWLIDATADRFVRLVLDLKDMITWSFGDPVAHGGRLWIGTRGRIMSMALADLEALLAHAGDITIKLHPRYPLRQSHKRLACVYLWKLQSGQHMVEIGDGKGGATEPKLRITLPELGLAKYSPVTLCDELVPGHYAFAEIPGHSPIALAAVDAVATLHGQIFDGKAKDPITVVKSKPVSIPTADRRAEIDRLVEQIASDPDNDGDRAVLVDLLQEIGDPTGELIAKVRAGARISAENRKVALGALAPFLTKVELDRGFPVAATLARESPDPDDHPDLIAAAVDDFRLALIHTLHMKGSAVTYARLVGSPRATALRRADASRGLVVDALIAGKRDRLERLDHVDFAARDVMPQLAHPTFDRVRVLHTVVGLAHLQPLMNRVIRDKHGVFARAPRELVLDETRARYVELVQAIRQWWARLPITALTIAGVTIDRAKSEVRATDAPPQLVAAARELV